MKSQSESKDLQQLIAQRDQLEAEIKKVRDQQVAEAITKIREMMTIYEISVADLGVAERKAAKSARASGKRTVAPKYIDKTTGATWTGRGKAPKWLQGKDREEYRI